MLNKLIKIMVILENYCIYVQSVIFGNCGGISFDEN